MRAKCVFSSFTDISIQINEFTLILLAQYANDNSDVDIMIISNIHSHRHQIVCIYFELLLFLSSFLFTIHFVQSNKHNKLKGESCAYHLTNNNLESSICKQLESTI